MAKHKMDGSYYACQPLPGQALISTPDQALRSRINFAAGINHVMEIDKRKK